ncbi:unnamed protein product [Rotaria magnacalcarata]|uniref:Uncharacterized protein n=1 Tax=Rotaria magnacalcarata TaxID=392030 RepID=A0A819DAV9_9BILA|nr:unnamed protein product [Rotaria magnacalcarata]
MVQYPPAAQQMRTDAHPEPYNANQLQESRSVHANFEKLHAVRTAVIIPIFIAQKVITTTTTTTTTTTSTSTSMSTASTTTTSTTTTTSETTALVACASGYSKSPSGTYVNLQIDFNNYGSFGNVCLSSSTTCSAGCDLAAPLHRPSPNAPAVQLLDTIAVPGWGGQFSIDDAYYTMTLPISPTIYGCTTSTVFVTSNGILCLGSCSASYTNTNLPTNSFGGPTAFGYWDDLMIYAGTSQSVYYSVSGTSPNQLATFEYYMSHYGQPTQYYHFQILLYKKMHLTHPVDLR